MLRERPFADTRAPTMPRASRAPNSTSCVAALILLLIRCFVQCAALEPASEVHLGTNANAQTGLPIRTPHDPRCPWLSEGVVGAARASPLVRAVVSRTRMAAPFGPGSWPDRLELAGESGEKKKYGWTDAVVFSLVVRVDPAKAQKWLPNSLLRVRGDTARVSNRPRLVQFAFDEVPSSDANAALTIRDASLYLNQTKTDAIAAPFQDTEPEVVSATFSVTNLYTGSEPTPTTGEEVPPGYVENDDVYWLRYQ